MNTPGQNSNAVAELALGMMVFMARNQFNGTSGTELYGKTLGIHAYGYVGRLVARIAGGFGMEIYAFDPYIDQKLMERDGVTSVNSAAVLYQTSQYVSLHIPATAETRGAINQELLSAMPEGAVLVNTARKEVVDEASLEKVFAERPDFRYISDIAPDNGATLKGAYPDRCFFTPKKMGAQTAEANVNAGVAAASQIVAFFEHGDTTFQVNK
jgi:D-3-phosphoglycerate dehydrogenase